MPGVREHAWTVKPISRAIAWRAGLETLAGAGEAILGSSDGKAVLRYGLVVSWTRRTWQWTQMIDRRFMRRYESLT